MELYLRFALAIAFLVSMGLLIEYKDSIMAYRYSREDQNVALEYSDQEAFEPKEVLLLSFRNHLDRGKYRFRDILPRKKILAIATRFK